MKKNGFTLVELLAVIVILGIILMIAVPKIMDTIDSSKYSSIESSTKMIAAEAEREYAIRNVLGDNTEITCGDVASLSSNDYDACDIEFDNSGIATVTITGKGQFDGYTCRGTKESTQCAGDGELLATAESCFATEQSFDYTIKDYNSCVNYITEPYQTSYEVTTEEIQTMCNGEDLWDWTTTQNFSYDIEQGLFTEQELINNNVIEKVIGGVSITGYSTTCEKNVIIPSKINEVTVTTIASNAFTTCGADVVPLSSINDTSKVMFLNYIDDKEISPTFILAPGCNGIGITSVIIPNTITNIGYQAFSYNDITSLIIPSSVTNIDDYAFSYNSINSVSFPETPLTVKCGVFFSNEGLDLVYPANVTEDCPLVK